MLPEQLLPFHVAIAAEDVVDEYVEAAAIALDACDQLGDRDGILVVDDERGSRPAGRLQQLAGLLDGLRPIDLRRAGSAAAAAGCVDEEPRAGELDGDRPTCAAGRARDERDPGFGSSSQGGG